ncbi:hypothetical protein XENOCAPTIV_013859 [Xenoophorus captivus]|uniref:Uncharacterized protein n=1 Tax=Xenoophorus captivus TaxID=1517983 RepID=A0ABV0SHY6_9TELE
MYCISYNLYKYDLSLLIFTRTRQGRKEAERDGFPVLQVQGEEMRVEGKGSLKVLAVSLLVEVEEWLFIHKWSSLLGKSASMWCQQQWWIKKKCPFSPGLEGKT